MATMFPTYGQPNMAKPGTTDPAYVRRRAMIQQLQGQAAQYRPAHSAAEALARALTPMAYAWEGKIEDDRAADRDKKFADDLTAASSASDPRNLARALAGSDNPDIRVMGSQMTMQQRMAEARAAARQEIKDPTGKHVIGHVDADGKTSWVPAHALPAELQGIQALAKAKATFDLDIAKARAGRAVNNVNVKVEGAGREELAKLGAKNFMTSQEASRDADKRSIILDRYETLMQGFQTGATADLRLRAKQIAKDTFGLDIGDGDIASGEALKATGRLLEIAATPKGQGQITENERVLIREQMPQLLNTPGGNVLIIKAIRELDEYDRKAAAVLRQVAKEGSGYVDPVRAAEEVAKLGPALSPSIYAAISGNRGGEAKSGAAAPQFKGDAPADAPATVREGQTATNPQTKQRLIYRGGQWVPLP